MLLSISEIADITGKDRRTIKRHAAALPMVKDGQSHQYESRDIIPLLYGATAASGEKLDLSQERARLARLQGDKADLEVKAMRGEYVKLEDAVEEVSASIADCRAKLLSLPGKAASLVVAAGDVKQARTILHTLVCEALDELYSQYTR